MASSCVRGGFDWLLAKFYLLEEWSGIGIGCPGRWLSHHPWNVQKTCRCGTSTYGFVGMVVMVGLDDLRDLFQPMILISDNFFFCLFHHPFAGQKKIHLYNINPNNRLLCDLDTILPVGLPIDS